MKYLKIVGAILLIGLIVLIILVYFGFNILYYGSIKGYISQCEYTESTLPIPAGLVNSIIKLEESQYLVTGDGSKMDGSCGPVLSKINREIEDKDTIGNPTIEEKYFTSKGLTISQLLAPKSFQLKSIISVTKNGLSAIDSGSRPIFFLILEDENGEVYKISTVHLDDGIRATSAPAYMRAYKDSQKPINLTWEYFEEYRALVRQNRP